MIDKINLITPLFIEVPVPRQKSERTCICVIDFVYFYGFTIGFWNSSG